MYYADRVFARHIAVAVGPLGLARALSAHGAAVSLLHASAPVVGAARSFVAWRPDRSSTAVDPWGDDDALPENSSAPFADVPRWIGVIPYEALRGIERPGWRAPDRRPPVAPSTPAWWRFGVVVCFDPDADGAMVVGRHRDEVLARAAEARRALAAARGSDGRRARLALAAEQEPLHLHLQRLERAVSLIHAGELYQVNLARRLEVEAEGPIVELYARLCQHAPSAFGCALALPGGVGVASTSPELLLDARADPVVGAPSGARFGRLATEPIKGTRPRGRDAVADLRLACDLEADPKERAELAMIIDVERNDLGRVCRVGSVRLLRGPEVVAHRTVHHRKATLVGRARADASRTEVLRAMLPSGSVTGAPKVRAMELIAELEAARRGLYTGAIGYCAHDGSIRLAMAIRTLVVEPAGGHGHYFAGGGIVAGSVPARELEETAWKAEQLFRALRPGDAAGVDG